MRFYDPSSCSCKRFDVATEKKKKKLPMHHLVCEWKFSYNNIFNMAMVDDDDDKNRIVKPKTSYHFGLWCMGNKRFIAIMTCKFLSMHENPSKNENKLFMTNKHINLFSKINFVALRNEMVVFFFSTYRAQWKPHTIYILWVMHAQVYAYNTYSGNNNSACIYKKISNATVCLR